MKRIQQSVEIGVPVHITYNQLTQFENYPRFLPDVETVHQLDDTHLHWVTKMANRDVEWDMEITEQEPDRCIAWHNTSGPAYAGKAEVQAVGPQASRVILTLEEDPDSVSGPAGANSEAEMAERLGQDLTRLKEFLETRASETGAWRGEVHDAQPVESDAQAQTAGSAGATELDRTTQSDYSLSQSSDDEAADRRFSIAEEVSFDLQSDASRRVGQAPQQDDAAATSAAEGIEQAMKPEGQQDNDDDGARLKKAIERATPPST